MPERIEAGTPIKPGERVRLSVEVPRTGFLYVLDREQYADGTLGAAYVIYPNFQTPQGDNAVAAGRQVEVPDRRDRISSFRLVRSRPEHTGEVLTVLVTPQPIPDLVTNSRQPAQVTSDRLAQWEREYGMQVEHLELVGGAGRTLTEAEREAGGDKQHLLTQSDAMPQTLYRVKSRPNQPLLLRLPLKIGG